MSCITEEEYKAMCKARPQSVFIYTHPALYDEVDKYWSKYSSPEWLIICQWFYAFYKDIIDAKQGRVNPQDNREYVWVNYGLLAQRLGCYGIRNPDTIGKWLSRLSADDDKYPPLLYKWVYFDLTTGHSNVYLAPTEACHRMFAVPKTAEGILEYKKRRALAESTEGSQIPDEDAPDETPVPEKTPTVFTFPSWWSHFWEEVSTTGKYKDKIYKDKEHTVINGYVQKTIKTINSILDGTYYNKGSYGEFHDIKYDLSAVTIDSIIDAMKKYNVKEPVTMDEVVCTFAGKGKNSRKSRFISLVCVGTEWPKDNVPARPKSFYEADKPNNAPDWIWEAHQLPSLYPEIQQDDRKFWGFYVTAIEYINDCQDNNGTDRTKWGLWAKLNNGITNPANNIFMDIFRSAKEAGMPLDEVYSMRMGDCSNFLWILTARRVKHSRGIKILPDGATKDNDYVYQYGPLNRTVYEGKH